MCPSHLITELGAVAEHLVIIGRGRLIAEIPMSQFGAGAAQRAVHVRSPQAAQLAELVRAEGVEIRAGADREVIEITGSGLTGIGEQAAAAGIVLYELTPRTVSLEQAFMDLTKDATDYTAHPAATAADIAGIAAIEQERRLMSIVDESNQDDTVTATATPEPAYRCGFEGRRPGARCPASGHQQPRRHPAPGDPIRVDQAPLGAILDDHDRLRGGAAGGLRRAGRLGRLRRGHPDRPAVAAADGGRSPVPIPPRSASPGSTSRS